MSRSLRMGPLASQCSGHAAFRFNCNNLKHYKRMFAAPTRDLLHLSASTRNSQGADRTADDLDDVNVALPVARKGWRVLRKISSGREGDLYQVASNDTDTASPHLLRVLSVKATHGEWWRLDALKAEANVIKRLSSPGIPSYVDSFDAAVPGDHLHYLLLRLDSALHDARLDTIAALADDGWRPTEEQARDISAQLLAILAHQRSFRPPYVHGSIGPGTVLIARAPNAARVGDDAPGGGASAWVVGPGWDGGRSAAGGDGAADPPPRTDLRGAGAALAHLATLGGSHRLPPGALGDLVNTLLAGWWPVPCSASGRPPPDQSAAALAAAKRKPGESWLGRLARYGGDAETVVRCRPAGCRLDARLVDSDADSDGIGAAAADLPACEDSGAGRAAVLELLVPSRELQPTPLTGIAFMLALAAVCFWLRVLQWYASFFFVIPPVIDKFLCDLAIATLLYLSAAATFDYVLEHATATVAVTARAMARVPVSRWWVGRPRPARELVVERKNTAVLRLIEGSQGWKVEMDHGTLSTAIADEPWSRDEAEWVVALLVARWPELAERVVRVKEG